MSLLSDFLNPILPHLSDEWKARYGAILHTEHLEKIAKNIALYQQGNSMHSPYFDTAPAYFPTKNQTERNESFELFLELLAAPPSAPHIENITFGHWLVVLGQQVTATSLLDERAIPPLAAVLLQSCQQPYNTEISVALRAWEKHIGRSEDPFWGIIKGNPAEKEVLVQERIAYIIDHAIGWNVFSHSKHGYIYELREPLGHGIRWTQNGVVFIGFLDRGKV